ncbi:unnamed protein product [Ilex paraguariensis]|uniref:rhomboid protease n=1 Tax=Ilex paraguariensis TaxID=185542 RepID=A0ABC8TYA6_9AQUA
MRANGDLENRGGTKSRDNTYPPTYYSSSYAESTETQWTSWLVPVIAVANVAMFFVIMYVNNCPKNIFGREGDCVARFLGRLSIEPTKENPLFGPSSSTHYNVL